MFSAPSAGPPSAPPLYAPPTIEPTPPPTTTAPSQQHFSPLPPTVPPPQYQSQPPPYSAPATYAPPVMQPPPGAYPGPQPAWAAGPSGRRPGLPKWVYVVLWVGVVAGALGVIWSIEQNLAGTSSNRWLFLTLGVLSAIAGSAAIAAILGLAARDQWGPTAGWITVAAFALTLLLAPLAAAVGWGLVQLPKSQLVSAERRPGGGRRAGSAALVAAVTLALVGSTAAWGWTHPAGTVAAGPSPSPSPTICAIAQPDSPITASAAGGLCAFNLGSPIVRLDCRAVTAPPPALKAVSYDYSKNTSGVLGGGGTLSMDSQGCHMTAPAYKIEEDLVSVDSLPAGDVLMLADLVPAQPVPKFSVDFFYGCDTVGCIDTYIWTPDSTLNILEDSTSLVSQHIDLRVGSNRLMMVVHQKEIRVWLNGNLIATESALRTHGAGKYYLTMESRSTTGPVRLDILQYYVFHLA
jgi:hypothetical protein